MKTPARILFSSVLVLAAVLLGSAAPAPSAALPDLNSRFPAEVAQALQSAKTATLFSLEPGGATPQPNDTVFHGVPVLGQANLDGQSLSIARAAFESAVAAWKPADGRALCFNPRHGLRVIANDHTYDLVLCYECQQIDIYRDDKKIAGLPAKGKPWDLNDLLTAAKVPLSKSGPTQAQDDAFQKAIADTQAHWFAAMPKSLQKIWKDDDWSSNPLGPARFIAPLAVEFPDVTARIRALLAWYGAGSKDWANVPVYQSLPLDLLHNYTTAQLVTAIQAAPLTDEQLNGAAHALISLGKVARPGSMPYFYELAAVPAEVKAQLRAYGLQSGNDYNILYVNSAFSPPPAPATTAAP